MFKNILIKTWSRLTGAKTGLQSFERQQAKFKKRYPNYSIGTGSYGLPIVHDYHEGSTLKIGNYCSIADNVQIFLGGQHRIDWVSSYPFSQFYQMDSEFNKNTSVSRGDVIIGSDVWLCANCTILSGVTIGHGAVIANGAVISRDVEPYAVMAGNPAKLIKWRFDEPIRADLLESKWWEWPEDEVKSILNILCTSDLSNFIDYANHRKYAK